MHKRTAIIGSIVLTLALPCSAQNGTGSIQGNIKSALGDPIVGAVALYHRVPILRRVDGHLQIAPGEAMISSSSSSDVLGSFSVVNLPAGRYVFCFTTPGEAYLDPCKWSGSLGVDVAAGQTSTVNLTLQMGVFLKVHVDDPKGLLVPLVDDPFRFDKLHVGVVVDQGGYWTADDTTVTKPGRDFTLAIPINRPLKLWASSSNLTITDKNGGPISVANPIVFQASTGVDQIFNLSVPGLATAPPSSGAAQQ